MRTVRVLSMVFDKYYCVGATCTNKHAYLLARAYEYARGRGSVLKSKINRCRLWVCVCVWKRKYSYMFLVPSPATGDVTVSVRDCTRLPGVRRPYEKIKTDNGPTEIRLHCRWRREVIKSQKALSASPRTVHAETYDDLMPPRVPSARLCERRRERLDVNEMASAGHAFSIRWTSEFLSTNFFFKYFWVI